MLSARFLAGTSGRLALRCGRGGRDGSAGASPLELSSELRGASLAPRLALRLGTGGGADCVGVVFTLRGGVIGCTRGGGGGGGRLRSFDGSGAGGAAEGSEEVEELASDPRALQIPPILLLRRGGTGGFS
jgi:hypothetical protein